MSTESELRDWKYGQTQAERLVADLLNIEGHKNIDPQHPLGGPDGKKDVLFENEGERWIAAAYFPTTQVSFADIQRKFAGDLEGVKLNGAHGIAFFVNQPLTAGERKALLELAHPRKTEVFHLERMRSMLDAPRGCGIRLQYLRIAMTEEEQWAFWQTMNSRVMETLVDSDRRLRSMDRKIDALLRRSQSIEYGIGEIKSSLVGTHEFRENEFGPTSSLNPSLLTWVHRLVTDGTTMTEELRGRFRSVQIWVDQEGVSLNAAKYVAPPPDEVYGLLDELLSHWRADYSGLVGADRELILKALAKLHHGLLSIHPFLDGNGRVARVVVDQAAHELLGMRISTELTGDRRAYYGALEEADRGNFDALITLFRVAMSR